MGASKSAHFTHRQNTLSAMAKALGHPARIAIMEHLLKVEACMCGQLVDQLPLAQPTVSQHLKELRDAGLVKGAMEGNTVCYCIDRRGIAKLQSWINDLAGRLSSLDDTCC